MSNKTTSHVHEPLVGRVQKIDQLAAFQKDSIVSTRVIQKAAGNVTFFAFDEGQELSEHAAPFDALLCVFDGETSVMVKDAWHTLKTGDGIIQNDAHHDPLITQGTHKTRSVHAPAPVTFSGRFPGFKKKSDGVSATA